MILFSAEIRSFIKEYSSDDRSCASVTVLFNRLIFALAARYPKPKC